MEAKLENQRLAAQNEWEAKKNALTEQYALNKQKQESVIAKYQRELTSLSENEVPGSDDCSKINCLNLLSAAQRKLLQIEKKYQSNMERQNTIRDISKQMDEVNQRGLNDLRNMFQPTTLPANTQMFNQGAPFPFQPHGFGTPIQTYPVNVPISNLNPPPQNIHGPFAPVYSQNQNPTQNVSSLPETPQQSEDYRRQRMEQAEQQNAILLKIAKGEFRG
jgi:hypothetical protein